MPKKSAKNITASTSFWLIALKKLLGTMATTASTPDFDSCALWMIEPARAAPSASRVFASSGSTPAPGWRALTTARLTATAIDDPTRADDGRVGKRCVSTRRSRGQTYHKKKKQK